MHPVQIISSTLLLYFANFWLMLIGRNYFSKKIGAWLAILVNTAGLSGGYLLLNSFENELHYQFNWVSLGNYQFYFSLLINKLSLMMWLLVQFIALLVQLFSIKYMAKEDGLVRYYAFLQLFLCSMLGLVTAGNLLFTFVFWELVGFSSWLLIGFWYSKEAPAHASLKAFLYNRIGDAAFLTGIGLLFALSNTLEYPTLREYFEGFNVLEIESLFGLKAENFMSLCGLLIFGGAIGKSAQFPLQVWLPEAMEGPTPVSALIHAATMVAAGIFLLARLDFIFTADANIFIAFVGSITALLAAWSAVFQNDIKKVLAYSTISQLGLMVIGAGVGVVNASLFHLLTHAFFKGGLFLAAGAIIYHYHHEQDMRKMGNYLKANPVIAWAFTLCAASLAGFPLFSGFLSKDPLLIHALEWAVNSQNSLFFIVPAAAISASLLTSWYITRQWVMVMYANTDNIAVKRNRRFGFFEITVLIFGMLSIFIWFGNSAFHFEKAYFFGHFPVKEAHFHFLGYFMAIASLIVAAISFTFYRKNPKFEANNKLALLGLNHFYLEKFYANQLIDGFCGYVRQLRHESINADVNTDLNTGKFAVHWVYKFDDLIVDGFVKVSTGLTLVVSKASHWLDHHLLDGIVNLISKIVNRAGGRFKDLQGGRIRQYIIGLILLILVFILILNLL